MFRKAFKIKSNSRLKTTEKKKLRNELLKEFPIIEEYFSLDALNLKSNISVVDLITSSGESVKVYTAPLYPSFIFYNGKYLPTVYMLWEIPTLVPSFVTYSPVIDKIKNGADLMLAGVIVDEPLTPQSYGSSKRGDPVAVSSSENPLAVAVGEASMSSIDMFNSGKRGKCVGIVHFFGDYLTELAPSIIEVPVKCNTDAICLSNSENDNLDGQLQNVLNITDDKTIENHLGENVSVWQVTPSDTSQVDGAIAYTDDSQETMEDLLHYCFFKSLVTSAKKAPLPLLTNVFYKVHMMNVYPQGSRIDIKKSKYKKLSTFLEEMSKSKVVTLELTSNGTHKIVGIDHAHPSIREFLKLNPSDSSGTEAKKPNIPRGPSISEKYTINATVLPLFSKYSFKKGDCVSQIEIRKVITSYIKEANLQDDSDKRFVKPDNLLKSVIKKDVNSLTWEDIMTSIVQIMGQSYQVSLPTNKTLSGKGKMPLIEIQVASRAGNKKVTLVNNLTFYGVNLNDFSKECQHGVAASTTINSLPHLKSEQVQIQGNQVIFIGKLLLEKYQIPKRYIRGLT